MMSDCILDHESRQMSGDPVRMEVGAGLDGRSARAQLPVLTEPGHLLGRGAHDVLRTLASQRMTPSGTDTVRRGQVGNFHMSD